MINKISLKFIITYEKIKNFYQNKFEATDESY